MNEASDCNCLALRRAGRRVTQIYDVALAPSGLRATQYPILEMIGAGSAVLMKDIAREMVMDRATIGHNLRPLEAQGLVAIGVGKDRRQRPLALTEAGRAKLRQARPLWQGAQDAFEEGFGESEAAALRGELARAASLRIEARS